MYLEFSCCERGFNRTPHGHMPVCGIPGRTAPKRVAQQQWITSSLPKLMDAYTTMLPRGILNKRRNDSDFESQQRTGATDQRSQEGTRAYLRGKRNRKWSPERLGKPNADARKRNKSRKMQNYLRTVSYGCAMHQERHQLPPIEAAAVLAAMWASN